VDRRQGSAARREETALTRPLPALLALPLAVALVTGCVGASAPDATTGPVATASGGSSMTSLPSDTPAATAATESVAVGDTNVAAGEAWIVGQRFVDPGKSEALGVYLVRPDGSGDHQLVPDLEGSQMHPVWSPDGMELTFVQENPEGSKELWVVGANGDGARMVATCEFPCNNINGPEWSPADPRGIYVGRDEGLSKFMLSRLDLDTGAMVDVVVREDGATAESWRLSPDAKRALVIRDILNDAKRAAIFVVDLATGDEQQLTDYAYDLDRPDWMPGGGVIFNTPGLATYNNGDAGPANLWTMDADGGNLRRLTNYTEQNSGATQPHVLDDGSGIVFTKVLDGTRLRPMAIVDMDGGNERYLTPTHSRGSHIDIRPLP
jgi:Tol biopolymer transport system component